MKVGLSMLFCLGYPFSYLLEQLKKIDVENVELVDDGLHALDRRRVRAIKKIAEKKGFKVTVHAPFADINIASTTRSLRRVVLRRLKRSILLSSQLSSRLWVFHSGLKTGVSHFYPGLDWELNLKSVRELLAAAEQHGIEIAIENTPEPFPFLLKSVKDFAQFLDALGETNLGLTLDIGHANINNQTYEFIKEFQGKIVHAHLHDNQGDFDYHLGIGSGNINWPKIVRAFREIDYKGILIVESERNVEESLQKIRALLQTV
jgi:sugar phosphate isomerase/epimerase